MDLKKLMFLKAATGGSVVLVEKTATGNPATFTAKVASSVKSLVIPLTYSQSGSGDPSLSNVRPITGVSSFTFTHNNSSIDVVFPAEPGTVYGGSLDLISGVLTLDYFGRKAKISEYTETIDYGDMTYYAFSKVMPYSVKNNNKQLCSIAKYAWNNESAKYDHFYIYNQKANEPRLMFYLAGEVDETKEFTVIAQLDESITVQLTPEQINAIKGNNTVWTDTTGDITVTYYDKQ